MHENKAGTLQSELSTWIFCFEMYLTRLVNQNNYAEVTVLREKRWGFANLTTFCKNCGFSMSYAVCRVWFSVFLNNNDVFLIFPSSTFHIFFSGWFCQGSYLAIDRAKTVIPRGHLYSLLPRLSFRRVHDKPSLFSSRYFVRNDYQADHEKLKITSQQKTISQISSGYDNILGTP